MNYQGLSLREAHHRLLRDGANELVLGKRVSLWSRFIHQFADLMVLILIGGSIFAFFAGEVVDASVILFVVFLNAGIGFVQEFRAEKAMEALQNMMVEKARVVRNGQQMMIVASEVVVGDVLIFHEGDKIAADAVIVESDMLKTQDAVLTGESLPVEKIVIAGKELSGDKKTLVGHKHDFDYGRNHVYMGTTVASGSGIGIVQATGMSTEFGKIAHLTTTSEADKSPLEVELDHIGLIVARVVMGFCLMLVVVNLFRGEAVLAALLFAVAVAVAAVPEGLPATITIALALGVQRLGQKNAIVKKLASVETLGSTSVICTDKTGTLTKNEMTVVVAKIDGEEYWFNGVGYSPKGTVTPLDTSLQHLLRGFVLCQDAALEKVRRQWRVLGDPTEGALIVALRKCKLKESVLYDKCVREKVLPFDSDRKMMTTVYSVKKTVARQWNFFRDWFGVKSHTFSCTKGAPDAVIARCTSMRKGGRKIQMTPTLRKQALASVAKFEKDALRVLALGSRSGVSGTAHASTSLEKGMCFEGLVGMIDPPREEVKNAVQEAYRAGIKVIMITGDSPVTALAIAESLNIVQTPDHQVITGAELANYSDAQLRTTLRGEVLFARVAPADKLRVVNACKSMKHIVAVTGDGVNDAPALKRADIGVAMGIAGTDVSREAADMILTDDSFSTIVSAVYEGRKIYENMKKFIFYVFSSNTGELVTIMVALTLQIPLPLTAIAILLVNLGTDVLPVLALGVDEPVDDLMSCKPRRMGERIMNRMFIARFIYIGFFIGISVVVLYLYILPRQGLDYARTIAFVTLIIVQLMNVYNSRSATRSVFVQNIFQWQIFGAVMISFCTALVLVQWDLLHPYIGTVDLTWFDWLLVAGVSLSVVVAEELRKLMVFVIHRRS